MVYALSPIKSEPTDCTDFPTFQAVAFGEVPALPQKLRLCATGSADDQPSCWWISLYEQASTPVIPSPHQ